MLFHKKCGDLLKLDLGKSVKCLAEFTVVGKFTAKPVRIELMLVTDKSVPIVFYCKKCHRVVEKDEEMVCRCDRCGDIHDSKTMKIPADSGGLFCEECIERFSDERTYPISIRNFKIQ